MTGLKISSILIIHDGFNFVYRPGASGMEEEAWVGRCYEDGGPKYRLTITRDQMKQILAGQ